jgi:hypothetical protein
MCMWLLLQIVEAKKNPTLCVILVKDIQIMGK